MLGCVNWIDGLICTPYSLSLSLFSLSNTPLIHYTHSLTVTQTHTSMSCLSPLSPITAITVIIYDPVKANNRLTHNKNLLPLSPIAVIIRSGESTGGAVEAVLGRVLDISTTVNEEERVYYKPILVIFWEGSWTYLQRCKKEGLREGVRDGNGISSSLSLLSLFSPHSLLLSPPLLVLKPLLSSTYAVVSRRKEEERRYYKPILVRTYAVVSRVGATSGIAKRCL